MFAPQAGKLHSGSTSHTQPETDALFEIFSFTQVQPSCSISCLFPQPKLAECEAERENAAITRDACAEMRELIAEELKRTHGDNTKPHALETSVEIGERCLVQALIPDSRTLIVDTGVKGLLVEMPLQEAMDFVSARAMLLQKCVRSHCSCPRPVPSFSGNDKQKSISSSLKEMMYIFEQSLTMSPSTSRNP